MKNQLLSFDQLAKEMEIIENDAKALILGGDGAGDPYATELSDPYTVDNSGFNPGAGSGHGSGGTGSGGYGSGGSNGSNSGGGSSNNSSGISTVNLLAFFDNNPSGTYQFGSTSSDGTTPIITKRNGQLMVSFDGGSSWMPTLDTVDIVGTNTRPLYPLENTPYYDYATDKFYTPLTTGADYNADQNFSGAFSIIGRVTGYSQLANWVNSFAISDQSDVRAHINNLFIDAMFFTTTADLIPHASGPSTLVISNLSAGTSELTVFMQKLNDSLYKDLIQNDVIKINSTGDKLTLSESSYQNYRNNGSFSNFLQTLK